ncbi:MAG TPA: hypothetical protein VLG50_00465 [Candidatus Saccharimonadales bacterium]|nr:hypothetical protein [Candidatus Saccharimonadales bacterium]
MGKKPRHNKTKFMRVSEADKKVVKSVKDKIKRLQKKGIDLSNEIKIPDLKKTTRKEFKQFEEFRKTFLNRAKSSQYNVIKNEKGVHFLKKEIDEIKRNIEIDTKRAERRRKEEEQKYGRQREIEKLILMKEPDEFGRMGKFDINNIDSRKEFMKKFERAEKRADPNYEDIRKRQMIENYIEKLYDVFNSDADPIAEMIYKMDINDFYDLYKREPRMQFDIVYVEELMEGYADEYAQEISYYIQRFNEGFYNDGLKNFPDVY